MQAHRIGQGAQQHRDTERVEPPEREPLGIGEDHVDRHAMFEDGVDMVGY